MKLLVFAGSLRKDSWNKKFALEAVRIAREAGAEVEFLDLKEYSMPVYDGDVEASSGIPEAAVALGKKIREADGMIVSTPEYNGGIAGPFKNVIDWLSREKPMSVSGKPLLLLGASTGALGAVRGLWHTRVPLEAISVLVFPDMMGLGGAEQAFDDEGKLKDEKKAQQLKKLVERYVAHVKKLSA